MGRKDRLLEAYAYLYGRGVVKTKTQVAEAMGATRPSVSKAFNGYEEYLTNDFLKKFCLAFPGLFNLNWLITGDGDMLAQSEMAQESRKDTEHTNTPPDIINQLIRQNTALIELLKAKEASMEKVMDELSEIKKELNEISSKIKAEPYEIGISTIQSVLSEEKQSVYVQKNAKKEDKFG